MAEKRPSEPRDPQGAGPAVETGARGEAGPNSAGGGPGKFVSITAVRQMQPVEKLGGASEFRVPKRYDYNKSTSDQYGLDPDPVTGHTFYGEFKDIRADMDYSYHNNYTKDRQLWQDAVIGEVTGSALPSARPWIVYVVARLRGQADRERCVCGVCGEAAWRGGAGMRRAAGFWPAPSGHASRAAGAPAGIQACAATVRSRCSRGWWPVACGVPRYTCGPMGAGKGYALQWMSQEGFFPMDSIVHIDPDLFKATMPEWAGYVRDPCVLPPPCPWCGTPPYGAVRCLGAGCYRPSSVCGVESAMQHRGCRPLRCWPPPAKTPIIRWRVACCVCAACVLRVCAALVVAFRHASLSIR